MFLADVRACRGWLVGTGLLWGAALTFVTAGASAELKQTGSNTVIPQQTAGTSCWGNASNCINGNETVEGRHR